MSFLWTVSIQMHVIQLGASTKELIRSVEVVVTGKHHAQCTLLTLIGRKEMSVS